MQSDLVGPIVLAVIAVFVMLFFVVALAKARRRRRAEFDEEAPRPILRERDAEPEPAPPEPVAEPVPVPREREREPEPEPEPLPEAEPEPEHKPEPSPEVEVDEALKKGLERTSSSFLGRINQILGRKPKVDQAVLDELEEALLIADVGVGLATRLVDELRAKLKSGALDSTDAVREALKSRIAEALGGASEAGDPLAAAAVPAVILFVGVNGVGKTTTIGKIAGQLTERGKTVVLAAGDTFRAAAVEQLEVWGERAGCRVIRGEASTDPASVIFNAIDHAKQTGAQVVLADTAGRLHTKTNLMDEIKKVKRAAGKARDGAPDHVWLVVDATTGQNALQQAREFHQTLGLTGIILTKLDGTAKGGVVVAIADALDLPVRFVGVGEKTEDLRPFDAKQFVEALFAG